MPIRPGILVSEILVPALAAGAEITLPHHLNENGLSPVVPHRIWPDGFSDIIVVSADTVNVTFKNIGGDPTTETTKYICLRWHSMQAYWRTAPQDWYKGPVSGGGPVFGQLPVYRNPNDTCTPYDPPIPERPAASTFAVGYEIFNVSDSAPNFVGFVNPWADPPDFALEWKDSGGNATGNQ